MTRPVRSKEELRQASDHLYYEIYMFQMLVQGMTSGIAGRSAINNALLESFAIHLRALIGFFYPENPRNDDIIAEDYFTHKNDWTNLRPARTKILERAKKRADKEVAHLTYTRLGITPDQKNWYFEEVYKDVQVLIDLFLENIPKDLLGSRWDSTKTKAK